MALNYSILLNKKKLNFNSDFDGTRNVEAYDLLDTTFNKMIKSDMITIYVTKDYIARPDLISFAKYGTDKYADIICKINGISNPFELNEGMYILIPDINSIDMYTDKLLIRDELQDVIINDESNELINNRKKEHQKLKNENRMPSEQVVGEQNFIIDKTHNIIFF